MSGLSAAIGYLLGTLAGYGVGALLRRLGREPTSRARRRAWLALGVAGAVVVVAGLALWPGWQNQQRALVGMERLSPAALAPMVAVTLVLFGLLLLVGRLPRLLAHAAIAALLVAATALVTRDLVVDGFLDWANRRFSAYDTTTAPGVVALTSPTASGSPASLVPWATLGEYGRSFAAGATSPAQLRAFHGPAADVEQPIRIYAGLRAAGSPDERAALAVRELERTGAFQREVLAVVTTTGTSWVDPNAASSLEYLHGGDTALVGLQYSYLPSWISFRVDREEAAETGTALYRHAHRRWWQLPATDRPRLIVFGESLGAEGAEAAFRGGDAAASLANLVGGSDGVLLTGPTASNPIWGQLTDAREPGSRLAARLRRRQGGPVRQPARQPRAARPGLAAASRPVRPPSLRPGRERHPGGVLAAAGVNRPAPGLRRPRPGRLVPDRHRAPAGVRPDRRLQRRLRPRAQQLRRRLLDILLALRGGDSNYATWKVGS